MTYHIEDAKHHLAVDKRGEPFVYSTRALAGIAAKVMKAHVGSKFWVVEK